MGKMWTWRFQACSPSGPRTCRRACSTSGPEGTRRKDHGRDSAPLRERPWGRCGRGDSRPAHHPGHVPVGGPVRRAGRRGRGRRTMEEIPRPFVSVHGEDVDVEIPGLLTIRATYLSEGLFDERAGGDPEEEDLYEVEVTHVEDVLLAPVQFPRLTPSAGPQWADG